MGLNCLIQGNIDLPTNEVKAEINTVNGCRPRTHRLDRYGHERQTRSCLEKRRDNRYWACWAYSYVETTVLVVGAMSRGPRWFAMPVPVCQLCLICQKRADLQRTQSYLPGHLLRCPALTNHSLCSTLSQVGCHCDRPIMPLLPKITSFSYSQKDTDGQLIAAMDCEDERCLCGTIGQ